jgi:2-polyprenyl-6-methoxyphenol hydroxylase-like FAD-dependent oxidoreductase
VPGKVLISGGGIAGCCAAWWLERYGYAVTIVEQAAEPRDGGYVIDFWGLGYDVAEKMGLLDELRRHDLVIRDFSIVDRQGRRISGFDQGALQELTGGRLLSLQRSALAASLYGAVKDRIGVRFGDGVVALTEGADGVDVAFQHAPSECFDLVLGADGLHSAVRRLVFGEEAQFERFLGYGVAAFRAPDYGHRSPHAYVTYGEPGRQIWRVTLADGTTVFLLVFAEAEASAIPLHDAARQKEFLTRRYAGGGGETEAVLRALAGTDDLYLDRVSQIVMPRWTEGRVALLGDACGCPSLLAGEGSSMAMAEAYTLAGELAAAGGDYGRAFGAYEARLRPYVERKQKGARGFAASFVPKTATRLWLQNLTINAVTRLGLTRLLFGPQLRQPMRLAEYKGA